MFAGAAGVGKDTSADYLVNSCGYTKLSFAEPLRQASTSVLRNLFQLKGVSDSWMTNRIAKETPLSELLPTSQQAIGTLSNLTPRRVMQLLGTDVIRTHIHADVWALLVKEKIARHREAGITRFVVSDFRFPNEYSVMASIENASVHTILLENATPVSDQHVSANALDGFHFDDVVDNDHTCGYRALYEVLDQIIGRID